ncbi:hypothetical protein GCM10020366_62790 [Saccharopolyspora gregorii]|uniref:Uncharacterized protein n=1 Tax=Saccharopolyspora gregorii TaxID=33914 RepID=A0ABP6RGF9_9PSEU
MLEDRDVVTAVDETLGHGEATDPGSDDENAHRIHPSCEAGWLADFSQQSYKSELSVLTYSDEHLSNGVMREVNPLGGRRAPPPRPRGK